MIPFEGWPRPFRPLREPLRTLIGKWEAHLISNHRGDHHTTRSMCENVEGFFYDHSKIKRPEQILITDVEDWRLAKLEDYSWNTVRSALCHLKTFYNWLIRETDYKGDCPVWVPLPHSSKQVPALQTGVTALHPSLHPTDEDAHKDPDL